MDDAPWITVSEAARLMGVSRTAVRNKMTRGTLPMMTGNRGQLMTKAELTPEKKVAPRVAEVSPDSLTQVRQHGVEPGPTSASTGMVSLAEVRAMLGEQAERQQRQHEAEIARLERAWRGAMEAQTEKYLKVMMANRPRPWWRFW